MYRNTTLTLDVALACRISAKLSSHIHKVVINILPGRKYIYNKSRGLLNIVLITTNCILYS